MKKMVFLLFVLVILLVVGCDFNDSPGVDEAEVDALLNKEVATLMEYHTRALASDDPDVLNEFTDYLSGLDKQYNSSLKEDFLAAAKSPSRVGGGTDYPPLADFPIRRDGDVYLSGGVTDAVSAIVSWVCPNATAGQYQHGAVLDLNKFDPTNLDASCFQTAISEGAAYETANEWMRKPNVAVLQSRDSLNQSALDSQQGIMNGYCSGAIETSYGFFKDYANIFSIITKSDNKYWYCTKVIWRVYNGLGIDVDSNTSRIDWASSGLYSFVKAYYKTIYFWSSSRAKAKLESYMDNAKKTIVISDEIYYSPYLSKYYEAIRY